MGGGVMAVGKPLLGVHDCTRSLGFCDELLVINCESSRGPKEWS